MAMTADLYLIPGPWPGRLVIVPRPRGGDWLADEVAAWRRLGVEIAVSLLTPDELDALDLTAEGAACRAQSIDFVSFPIADREVPASRAAALDLLRRLAADLAAGRTVAVHCRQGIGRSALVAGGLLVLSGLDPEAAIQAVSDARRLPVPETAEQKAWITAVARELGRTSAVPR
jgi:hypothetical protein